MFNSVVHADYCDNAIPEMKRLLKSNPVNDAQKSLHAGDKRFLASYGFTYLILGVSSEKSVEILKSENYRAIEGSGSNLCSWPASPPNLFNDINNYIKIYNKTILSTEH